MADPATPTRMPRAMRAFLDSEAAGGIVLMAAAAVAMLLANLPTAHAYEAVLHSYLGPLTVHQSINDGLMALFFLLVGLEIKRALIDGHLASARARWLPAIAATGGMALPALVYLWVAGGDPQLHRGWAIPAATDIAFAVGVLALLGRRAPDSLKLLLVTIAIVDDMGAVIIIALFYSTGLDVAALALAAGILVLMVALNLHGHRRLPTYLVLAALLWLAVLLSGVHATVAGVLAALTIPLRPAPGQNPRAHPREGSPLARLEHALQPAVAFVIVPLFGLANAGVALTGPGPDVLVAPLPLAIGAGLFLGKQIGVFLSVRIAVAMRLGNKPAGATWFQIWGVSVLCGIGFTMSLFIGGLAFDDPLLADEVKIGVLAGSILSGLVGWLLLRVARGEERRT
ncbi:NhaA family Na+:H+ antiporter [Sphingomonas jejuensis]|uniref:Na(+)/H(+) antiporter NhaA n=1 Tax=Sphingomonas jejuensis TaxID=904715 RepID=A0ABX0XQX0_9SPHN|nr:Na+/H+ antiporter NhaA [Sphingomonas jejuensis]NJC35102.1 NhaA family Na+:H+ antiporter [Sphingomonas jejuensis]